MKRSTFLRAVLVLATATAACESDPLALDTAESTAGDELAAVLVSESGTADPRGTRDNADRSNSVFERLAAAIPGFGGLYRIEPCVIGLVLTEDADVQEAVRIVTAAIEPLVVRTCPTGIRIEPVRGQYTYVELRRMLLASRPLMTIPGVSGAFISFKNNSVVIIVSSRRVAQRVLHVLPRLGIPEDAVMFQLGSRLERPQSTASR